VIPRAAPPPCVLAVKRGPAGTDPGGVEAAGRICLDDQRRFLGAHLFTKRADIDQPWLGTGMSAGRQPVGRVPRWVLSLSSAPGRPRAGLSPPGGLTLNSSPKEIAAPIFTEAKRRGYSPERAIAIVATFMQESGLNRRAVSPHGQWQGLAQQDTSYPGRRNPNLALSESFDRLDAKGGRDSTDIWKTICWLRQRPGKPSAQEALAHGRRAYLGEIQRHVQAATQLYRELSAAQPTTCRFANCVTYTHLKWRKWKTRPALISQCQIRSGRKRCTGARPAVHMHPSEEKLLTSTRQRCANSVVAQRCLPRHLRQLTAATV
jgi:hypothetical protein